MCIDNLRSPHLGPISLAASAGECLCLSGPSGSGKTLLLRAIADLDPHQGEVYLDGTPCRAFTPPEWRRRVGLLSADSGWWADRVGPHFPRVDEAALAALGFEPDVMGWEVRRLSSGERQRLALLRMLVNRPQVVLLDEPTANLDAANAARVERLLATYRAERGAVMLWVSHDAEQIRRVADRRLRMAGGRLTEEVA